MSDSLDDISAAFRAEADQAAAASAQLARLVGSYFVELVGNGVPPEYAVDITLDYQATVMRPNGAEDGDA